MIVFTPLFEWPIEKNILLHWLLIECMVNLELYKMYYRKFKVNIANRTIDAKYSKEILMQCDVIKSRKFQAFLFCFYFVFVFFSFSKNSTDFSRKMKIERKPAQQGFTQQRRFYFYEKTKQNKTKKQKTKQNKTTTTTTTPTTNKNKTSTNTQTSHTYSNKTPTRHTPIQDVQDQSLEIQALSSRRKMILWS